VIVLFAASCGTATVFETRPRRTPWLRYVSVCGFAGGLVAVLADVTLGRIALYGLGSASAARLSFAVGFGAAAAYARGQRRQWLAAGSGLLSLGWTALLATAWLGGVAAAGLWVGGLVVMGFGGAVLGVDVAVNDRLADVSDRLTPPSG
jgi:hypothetical protein